MYLALSDFIANPIHRLVSPRFGNRVVALPCIRIFLVGNFIGPFPCIEFAPNPRKPVCAHALQCFFDFFQHLIVRGTHLSRWDFTRGAFIDSSFLLQDSHTRHSLHRCLSSRNSRNSLIASSVLNKPSLLALEIDIAWSRWYGHVSSHFKSKFFHIAE